MKHNVLIEQESSFLKYLSLLNIISFIIIVLTLKILTTSWYIFAWLPAVALIVLYVAIRYPKPLFCLFIFLIPFNAYTNFFQSYKFLTVPKLIGLLLIFVLVMHTVTNQSILKRSSQLWGFLGLFLIVSIFSALLSDYQLTSINNLRKLLTAFLVFYFTLYYFNEEDIKRTLHKVFVISISISAFLSVIGYLFNISALSIGHASSSLKRATGAENDPNFLASMAIFSLPFICHYLFSAKVTLSKLFWVFLFGINMAAIILSYSRSGAVITAIILFLLMRFYYHYITPKTLGFSIIILLVALFTFSVMTPMSYWERLGSVTETKTDTSLGRRWSYLKVAEEQFLESPVLGSGLGTFRDYYQRSIYALAFQKSGKTNRRAAHNAYVEVLVGTGLVGFLSYGALLVCSLRLFRKARLAFVEKGDEELASLSSAYCIALISLLGYSFFLSNLFHEYIWICFGVSQLLFNLSNTMPKICDEVKV